MASRMADHCNLCKKRRKALEDGKLVEAANSMHISDFFQQYYSTGVELWLQDELAAVIPKVSVLRGDAESLQSSILDSCFAMIEKTSAEDYKSSEIKWSAAKKKKEMRLPDMRYVVLTTLSHDSDETEVVGFVSFMITYEDGREVVYCYEIHLAKEWQGKSIGKKLMKVVEDVGKKVGVEKSMLTVFKSNQRALKMYEKLGYVEDEYSPGPRKLRNGTLKEPSYQILSKRLVQET